MNIPLINYIADDPKIKINFPKDQRGAVEFTWNPIYKFRSGEMVEEVTDVEYKLIYTLNEDINMYSQCAFERSKAVTHIKVSGD